MNTPTGCAVMVDFTSFGKLYARDINKFFICLDPLYYYYYYSFIEGSGFGLSLARFSLRRMLPHRLLSLF
jgi:hypothetical protein